MSEAIRLAMDAKTMRRLLGGPSLIELDLLGKLWLTGVIENLKQVYDGLETFDSSRSISIQQSLGYTEQEGSHSYRKRRTCGIGSRCIADTLGQRLSQSVKRSNGSLAFIHSSLKLVPRRFSEMSF